MSKMIIIEGNSNDKDNVRTFMVKGERGFGITSVEKTSTSGLVDTYTITFDDGTTETFDVTNGNGIASIEKTSTSGNVDTYTITFTNGTTTTFTVTNASIEGFEWGQIGGDIEDQTDLITKFGTKANNKKVYDITLDTTWSGNTAPYTKTVTVNGILDTDIVNIYPIYSDNLSTRETQKENYNKISMLTSTTNSITLICDEDYPTVALNCRLEVVY